MLHNLTADKQDNVTLQLLYCSLGKLGFKFFCPSLLMTQNLFCTIVRYCKSTKLKMKVLMQITFPTLLINHSFQINKIKISLLFSDLCSKNVILAFFLVYSEFLSICTPVNTIIWSKHRSSIIFQHCIIFSKCVKTNVNHKGVLGPSIFMMLQHSWTKHYIPNWICQ